MLLCNQTAYKWTIYSAARKCCGHASSWWWDENLWETQWITGSVVAHARARSSSFVVCSLIAATATARFVCLFVCACCSNKKMMNSIELHVRNQSSNNNNNNMQSALSHSSSTHSLITQVRSLLSCSALALLVKHTYVAAACLYSILFIHVSLSLNKLRVYHID